MSAQIILLAEARAARRPAPRGLPMWSRLTIDALAALALWGCVWTLSAWVL